MKQLITNYAIQPFCFYHLLVPPIYPVPSNIHKRNRQNFLYRENRSTKVSKQSNRPKGCVKHVGMLQCATIKWQLRTYDNYILSQTSMELNIAKQAKGFWMVNGKSTIEQNCLVIWNTHLSTSCELPSTVEYSESVSLLLVTLFTPTMYTKLLDIPGNEHKIYNKK